MKLATLIESLKFFISKIAKTFGSENLCQNLSLNLFMIPSTAVKLPNVNFDMDLLFKCIPQYIRIFG